jgi:hypothetical protein
MREIVLAGLILVGRFFVAALLPFYGGYVGAPITSFLLYMVVVGACWLWQAGAKTIWRESGLLGIGMSSLWMTIQLMPIATLLYGLGRLIHWYGNSN